MHQEQTVRQEIQLPGHPPIAPEPTSMEWFNAISGFWVAGILPFVIIYFGYRSLRLKTEAANRLRQRAWEESHKDDDDAPSDRTVLEHVRTLMKEERK